MDPESLAMCQLCSFALSSSARAFLAASFVASCALSTTSANLPPVLSSTRSPALSIAWPVNCSTLSAFCASRPLALSRNPMSCVLSPGATLSLGHCGRCRLPPQLRPLTEQGAPRPPHRLDGGGTQRPDTERQRRQRDVGRIQQELLPGQWDREDRHVGQAAADHQRQSPPLVGQIGRA